MNEQAAQIISQGFLKGTFDVYDALLSLSFGFEATSTSELTEEALSSLLGTYSAVMQGKVLDGGGVAVLTTVEEAARLISLTNTGKATAKDSLDDTDLGTFQEIAMSVLGGGISNLMEQFGQDIEFENTQALVSGGDQGATLLDYLGGLPCTVIEFTFSAAPEFDAKGVFICTDSLEGRIPPDLLGEEGPLVSDDEMEDILSGFAEGDIAQSSDEEVKNIDMVLDIELIATARLGKVEMPIADILMLGPGSIIEVGQLVDEPVELLVNDRLVARGDVVVVDEKFGLRITQIVSRKERIESLR